MEVKDNSFAHRKGFECIEISAEFDFNIYKDMHWHDTWFEGIAMPVQSYFNFHEYD